MAKEGKWQQRRFYAKMERLLGLEKKCMGNLVQVETSLVSCLESLTEDYKEKKEGNYLGFINKITNEFDGMVKTHTQLDLKIGEAQSRLSDILRSKEDSCPELEMMFFVLESGLRQSRTGFLKALENGLSGTPSPILPPRFNRKQSITPSQLDDTMMLMTNNPFETNSTNTDIIDEEEAETEGELMFEDLSVENYSNPFGGLSGPHLQDDSPSPPPKRSMASSANAAERAEVKMPSSPLILSSEKLAKSSHQIGGLKKTTSAKNPAFETPLNQTPSPDPASSFVGSIKLPAVSPQATSSFLSNGEVFREDEKSKKKKKKDTAKEKKKKPKAKEKGKTARISPLEETIKKFNMKGEESSSDYDEDSSESSKPSLPTSPFGTPVRVAFLKGDSSVYLGQKSSGSTLSREINEAPCSDEEDDSSEGCLATYHNPFGDAGGEGGEGGEEAEGKKGEDISSKRSAPSAFTSPFLQKEKLPKKNTLLSRSSAPIIAKSEGLLKSMPSSPEPPLLPSFVSLSEFVNLALFGDARYRQALVLSYSHFSSAKEVIELLKNKFLEEEEKIDTQQKVLALVSYWLERSYFDLVSSEESLLDLISVIQEHQEKWGKALLTKFSTKKLSYSTGDQGYTPTLNWDGLSEGDLALSVTHAEAMIFDRITPSELLAWNTKKKATHCPAIHRAIAFSTRLSGWITSEIVKRMKLKDRARLVTKFILLGEHLLEFRNFSGCMAVIGGLTSSAVWRMKKTWESVSRDIFTTFEGLKKVMSHTSSYASYRAYLKGSNPPRIPFLGVSLSDLTFIDDGNKSKMEEGDMEGDWDQFKGGLNVNKWLLLTKVLSEFQSSQSVSFREVYPPAKGDFVKALSSHKILSETEVHRLSYFAEPKDAEEAMEEALQMYNEAQKKLNSLEEGLGNKDATSEPPLSYSPPLFKLRNRLPSQPTKKTSPKTRSLPLRGSPRTKRTFSQPKVED